MKYNLKNRPKLNDFEDNYQYVNEAEGWFKEFEKELREKLRFQSKYHVIDTYGMRIMKEILGEE